MLSDASVFTRRSSSIIGFLSVFLVLLYELRTVKLDLIELLPLALISAGLFHHVRDWLKRVFLVR